MMNLKSILLAAILFTCIMFIGCSKDQAKTNDTLSNDEYSQKLKSITTTIFEEKNYINKDKVKSFTKDMNLKSNKDKQSNQWYYEDQIYVFTIQNMYLDLYNKLDGIICSDDVTSSIHKSIIAQLKDLNETTLVVLQEYSNNSDPKSLNSSIPKIKLIFTDNPNEFTVSELVRNEVNGRIKRINSSIEGIINQKVVDISKGALKDSDKDANVQEEKKEKQNTSQNSQDNISKAKEAILRAIKNTELTGTTVVLEYNSNPGASIDGSKYYVFGAGDGDVEFDCMYLVDKKTFEVYEFYPNGDMIKISGGSSSNSQNNKDSQTQVNLNQNQIPGGITCKEAYDKITSGYGAIYKYNGSPNGEISYELYNSVEQKEEPAYVFGFTNTETGDGYVGWVYGDGDYMMRGVFD